MGDIDWLGGHYSQLSEQFPNQWVAIKNRTVIASTPDHEALLNELQTQGKNPSLILRHYIGS